MAQRTRRSRLKDRPRGYAAPAPAASQTIKRRARWLLSGRAGLLAAGLAGGLVLAAGLSTRLLTSSAPGQRLSGEAAAFVGSEACASCHRAQAEQWRRSQHKHAMDHATPQSVLGDFSNATFDYWGVRSRFFREGEKFFVETDGADGKLA